MIKPLAGVNLGGWLVLEPWITPSVFAGTDAIDEYSYFKGADSLARQKIRHHRDTFITEQDFAWLADHGVAAVRLPVGYWLFGKNPPYDKTINYVDHAFTWAAKYNLKILIDLHGAPGSQNGTVHSGQAGETQWHRRPMAMHETLAVLQLLAQRYGHNTALLGIAVLNEPSPRIPHAQLLSFYKAAYTMLRQHCADDAWIVCSDAFKPRRWRHVFSATNYPNLYIDHHQYQLYTWFDKRLTVRQQLLRAKYLLPGKLRRMTVWHPIVVGEWSLALRSDKLSAYNKNQRAKVVQNYGKTQLQALSASQAWFYWTYKTESGGAWSFKDCVEQGLLKLQ